MLRQLTINNYAIVDHLDIDLDSGMTVITGETGAGKSIMLDALGLTLGDRADREVIRPDAQGADISACFQLAGNPTAIDWINAHDFDHDPDECILRRVITRDGRSKAYINGQLTTLNELKELGEMLVDIHSQHEHQSLLKQATHQRLLDEYCGLQNLVAKVRETASKWKSQQLALAKLQEQSEEDNAQFQLISYQVQELDELNLEENELEQLDQEHQRLTHAESSLQVIQQLIDLCSENEEHNIQQALNHGLSLLQHTPYAGKELTETGNLLKNALIQVDEASRELSRALDRVDLNPERLEEVDLRLGVIHQTARKHRISPSELTDLHRKLKEQLEGMSHTDVKMEALQKQLDGLEKSWHEDAGTLSEARQKGALALAKEINARLADLGMEGACFELALNTKTTAIPSGGGYDTAEFLVSTNAGQPPRPMIKVASGGELSRISLAIQVVTATTSAIPTLVFDEVDVGIGGGVAKSVGELLRQLGEKGQIICVTHQPQVASQGHHHFFVSKNTVGEKTQTRVTELEQQARVKEIARMLDGDQLTDKSVAHAREMMT